MIFYILGSLINSISIIAILSFILSKVSVVRQLISKRKSNYIDKIIFSIFFGILGIVGTYSGMPVDGALANSRIIGVFVGGLFGGPFVGMMSGLIAGVHRWSIDIGGFTALACAISTTVEGIMAGMLSKKFFSSNNKWLFSLFFGAIAEIIQMIIIITVATPLSEAINLVSIIGIPMIIANAIGISITIAIVNSVLKDKEREGAFQAERALKIANETLPHFRQGFNIETSKKVADIIYEMTSFKAVALTNRDIILAHKGEGEDHHFAENKIKTDLTKQVIYSGKYKIANNSIEILCKKDRCKLKSAIIVPLKEGEKIVGTLKLYKTRESSISPVDVKLALGLGSLFSTQIELRRIEEHKELATKSELTALQAQINPHFLFNAINTIVSLIRTKPDRARELLLHLGFYFRKNLYKTEELVTLSTELEHVKSYLEIEQARFGDKLDIKFNIEKNLEVKLPPLLIQPIVENSIKHGIMNKLEGGEIIISAFSKDDMTHITVEDNGEGIEDKKIKDILSGNINNKSIGLLNVHKRIQLIYGSEYGLNIKSNKDMGTEVSILLPKGEVII
ncbi:LytS/YhcK type 5TM receptor domain-containing protein [Senegalia massiliensis]|uniref:LytS/YhcK type 5TM receptor domain-containing protein n=1 Tax=Senegalia massiliensis TaxID=1720316 RepID=UPI00103092EE|nr:LytS/YhcK type 5TM receptor domain-containing protein [Senegalia massiliensis]